MKFDLFDGGDDGEYNGFGFVEISGIFSMERTYFFGTEPSDRVSLLASSVIPFSNTSVASLPDTTIF